MRNVRDQFSFKVYTASDNKRCLLSLYYIVMHKYKKSKSIHQLLQSARTSITLPFVQDFFCIKCNSVSMASSNFSNQEYWQRFRIKRRGVSPSPTVWWASCFFSFERHAFHQISSIIVHSCNCRLKLNAYFAPFSHSAVDSEDDRHQPKLLAKCSRK